MNVAAFAVVFLALLGAGVTWRLTALVRRWAISRAVIDRPNARSLHAVPTPRGGGLAIALSVLLLEGGFLVLGVLPFRIGVASWLATGILALLGMRDDLKSLSAATRFGVQVAVCVVWTGWVLAASPEVWAILRVIALSVSMVWIINLYNFMDGSDGLAATQSICAAGVGAWLAYRLGLSSVAWSAWLLAACSVGFLRWNWPPARIFLGDVGSYFLGGKFAVLAVTTFSLGSPPWFWCILLGPFVVDATLTLLRRMRGGERWLVAHRTHAYQLLAQTGWSHPQIVRGFITVWGIFCVPLAMLSVRYPDSAFLCVLLCYGFLGTIWGRIVRARLRVMP